MGKSGYRVEAVKGHTTYMRLVSTANGETIMVGESYKTWWGCRRAAKRLANKNGFEFKEVLRG